MTEAVRITDTTLRDGSHAMAHRFTIDQVRAVVTALDDAGVEVIEVTHGDGLGGSSFNYGFSAVPDVDLVAAAAETARRARIAVLLLSGAGAGNSPTEVLAAAFAKMGVPTGLDLPALLAAAADVALPFIPRLPWAERAAIGQGYAGVYSSFLRDAERAEER